MHDIWVLTRWGVSDLHAALSDGETALYILTNSRSMPLTDAQQVNREIADHPCAGLHSTRRQLPWSAAAISTRAGTSWRGTRSRPGAAQAQGAEIRRHLHHPVLPPKVTFHDR